MRWGWFALVLLGVYLVQVAVLPVIGLRHVDLLLALALVCAMLAPTHEARIAGWIAGLVQDLGSQDVLGLHALALGLAAYFFTRMREFFNIRVWWTRLGVTLIAALPGQLLIPLHVHYWAGRGEASIAGMTGTALLISLLAALVATIAAGLPGLTIHRRRRFRAIRHSS